MFKRCQVLLSDWLVDYAKFLAEKYDLSFSEVIRICLCIFFTEMVSELYTEYKFPMKRKEMLSIFSKIANKKISQETKHKIISEGYFEARKAMEYRLKQEKKLLK